MFQKSIFFLLAWLFAFSSYAAEKVNPTPTETVPIEIPAPPADPAEQKADTPADKVLKDVKKSTDQVAAQVSLSRQRRSESNYFAFADYSLIDLVIPNKYGATIGLFQDADRSWELEYLRGSVSVPFIISDLGEMTDQRISLIRRSYAGRNSFNVSYGFSYFDFSMHIGDDMLGRITAGAYPSSIDLIRLQSLGFNLGIGNRWTFNRNITLGIDWIAWSQPVLITKKDSAFLDYASNSEDKDDVEKGLNTVSYFPRLTFLKVQFGILF